MTQQEYRDFLHSIHAIDRTVVEVAYMSALGEEERRECLSLLLHRAEEIREPEDKVKALWAETAEKMEEKKRESIFANFAIFAPPDESKKPSFPVEHLPDGIREMVEEIAESLQVSPDMPASAVLGILSVCLQGKFLVRIKPDWEENVNLYILVIARPSERKSPVLQNLVYPLYLYTKEQNIIRGPEIQEYRTKKKILEGAIENLTTRAAKKGDVEYTEIAEKQRELDSLKPVYPVRLTADDVTTEKLVSLMMENKEVMAIISAEGGIFNMLAGRYNDKVNIDLILKAYTGESLLVDRVGRPPEQLNSPHLTICTMIQPSILREVLGNREFQDRGFTARFLYSYPRSMVGKGRRFETTPIQNDTREIYEALLYALLKIPLEPQPRAVSLSREAYLLLSDWFAWVEDRMNEDFYGLEAWAGKLVGTTARIAALLHCCTCQEQSAEQPVSGKTMQDAIEIAKYFVSHAIYVFEESGETDTPAERDAKYILKRLKSTGEMEITKRDLFELCKGKENLQTVDDMAPGLDVLIDRGYIAIEKVKTGGRGRPTEKIYLNPETQKSQNSQKYPEHKNI